MTRCLLVCFLSRDLIRGPLKGSCSFNILLSLTLLWTVVLDQFCPFPGIQASLVNLCVSAFAVVFQTPFCSDTSSWCLSLSFIIVILNNFIMACPNFMPADFAKWNMTASCFRIPRKLIRQVPIKEVRVLLVKAIGEERVCAVQALPDSKYRIEFASPSISTIMISMGLAFGGLILSPSRHLSSWSKSL